MQETQQAPVVANLAAEYRFAEEGHRAIVQPGGTIRVVSDTLHEKAYEVAFIAGRVGEPVTFTCSPRATHGADAYREGHLDLRSTRPGVVTCKHAAGAARRLEREGLIELTAEGWIATDRGAAPEPDPSIDPFAGLT